MYIKQIIIQGFKSYKDQTVIEPFSPKHNVIVGRNGSGKSNFFAAIRFVLSDAYTQMSREERQALLHEGSGSAVQSAYVEVIFDNSDERFPTGKDELILRRTIGMKKDEYTLDRKNATKSDVMNLLESAGFSRSNPYYIIPQGRVTALTNMKDVERLNLLKEVAGTQVYEARRTESIRIMADTDAKRTKIDELLTYIRERLDELEEEKEELREYYNLDRERRCLEYTIYHRRQEEVARRMEELENLRVSGADETDDDRDRFIVGEKALTRMDEEVKALKQRMDLLNLDKKQFEDERRDLAKLRAKTELEVNKIADGQSAAQSSRARLETDLEEVQNLISGREEQLLQLTPDYNRARDQENTLKAQLLDAEGSRQRLYAKQGRSAKFKNKKERDAWLREEIEEVNVALATRKAVTMETTEEIGKLESDIQRIEKTIADIRKRLDSRGDHMQALSLEVQKAKEGRDLVQDQRKELWREEARLDSILRNTRQELDRAERLLSHTMDQNTSRGLSAVRRIKQQQGLDGLYGLYGTLGELFEVPDRYKTAAEVTAGNSLFHYVVDNDETATKVMEVLQREKCGRVTFMPLNRLNPHNVNIPAANDAVPLISKLKFNAQFEKALQHVFGKTIVCPNLQIAAQYARSHGVSAITPEGDRSDKKGALTGGYHDPRQSRLDAIHSLMKWRKEYETQHARSEEIKRELEIMDQVVTRAVGNLQKVEQKKEQGESSYGPLQEELRNTITDLQSKGDAMKVKQISKTDAETASRELGEQQTSYETELASDFKKVLNRDEDQQLESLSSLIPDLRKQYTSISTTRSDLEAQKATIEVELQENLRPRLDQLKNQEHESSTAGGSSSLKERQKELKRINKNMESVETKVREAEEAIDEVTSAISELGKSRADKQREQEETARSIERFQRKMEKSMAKKSMLTEEAAEASRNVRDLGVLPEDAFTRFTSMPSDKILKRLHGVNESLKKYGHVNKKAVEQYNNFTKQRDTLDKRRAELDTSQNSIRELIEVLDQRKDEAIERTFKQVSKEFAYVFEKLVPAGRGRLIIQRKSDRERAAHANDDDSGGEEDGRDSVENYTGVAISVSFNSKHDEQQRIQQLSGGQKSLCALALVFAIQRCDPAPFYLFDEIDANLDAQYRTAVAALLQQISDGGQFICTTFRPEMVLVAEKCYGVAYSNKTSSIDVVSREEALKFVEGQVGGT